MLKAGIIGCGGMSSFHIDGYLSAGVQINSVCDVDEEIAKKVAQRCGASYTTDYKKILANPQIDMVSVLTYSRSHKEICLAAIGAGKGIICEKTLADNTEDSKEILSAAEKAGVFFVIGYMKRHFPATQKARELLDEMGQIISVYARSWQPAPDLWNLSTDVVVDFSSQVHKKYSGGVLVCAGSHILDLINFFAGKPISVIGNLLYREGTNLDIQANAMMVCESGAVVHFEACWHPLRFAGYERNGWDERIEINTSKGRLDLYTVTWDKPMNNGALLVHQNAETGVTTEYRYPPVNPFNIEIAENIKRFESKESGFPSAQDGYIVDRIISEIVRSNKNGAVIKIDWDDCKIE